MSSHQGQGLRYKNPTQRSETTPRTRLRIACFESEPRRGKSEELFVIMYFFLAFFARNELILKREGISLIRSLNERVLLEKCHLPHTSPCGHCPRKTGTRGSLIVRSSAWVSPAQKVVAHPQAMGAPQLFAKEAPSHGMP